MNYYTQSPQEHLTFTNQITNPDGEIFEVTEEFPQDEYYDSNVPLTYLAGQPESNLPAGVYEYRLEGQPVYRQHFQLLEDEHVYAITTATTTAYESMQPMVASLPSQLPAQTALQVISLHEVTVDKICYYQMMADGTACYVKCENLEMLVDECLPALLGVASMLPSSKE